MKSITFPESTNKIAEHQEEFETVHVQFQNEDMSANMCFELSPEEIKEVSTTGKIWYKQVLGSQLMHPMRLSPFKEVIIQQKEKIVMVCESDCGKKPHRETVGSTEYIFCCENGFKKSLEEFTKSIK